MKNLKTFNEFLNESSSLSFAEAIRQDPNTPGTEEILDMLGVSSSEDVRIVHGVYDSSSKEYKKLRNIRDWIPVLRVSAFAKYTGSDVWYNDKLNVIKIWRPGSINNGKGLYSFYVPTDSTKLIGKITD